MSVQLENGYVRIANELLDAIVSFDFTKRQYKVLLAVIRKTYGYGKKEDDMTLTQIANMTGLGISHVSETLTQLEHMGVFPKREGEYGYVIGLNKNYGQWRCSQNGKATKQVPKTGTSGSQNGKHNIQLQKTKNHCADPARLDEMFFEFYAAYPKKRSKGQAEKAWKKLKPDESLLEKMLIALERAKNSDDWKKENGKYIPYPASWLNAKGWDDEIQPPKRKQVAI